MAIDCPSHLYTLKSGHVEITETNRRVDQPLFDVLERAKASGYLCFCPHRNEARGTEARTITASVGLPDRIQKILRRYLAKIRARSVDWWKISACALPKRIAVPACFPSTTQRSDWPHCSTNWPPHRLKRAQVASGTDRFIHKSRGTRGIRITDVTSCHCVDEPVSYTWLCVVRKRDRNSSELEADRRSRLSEHWPVGNSASHPV